MYKYERVANNIMRDIKLQVLRPGHKLPTDEQLMINYHASRVTVRKAIDYLVDSGIVNNKRHQRLITDTVSNLEDTFTQFRPLVPIICTEEITNVITESEVEQSNPFSQELFHRNIGAYFKVDLWYQHNNTIIANTRSIVPAELVSSSSTDMYNKKDIQRLIEEKVYDIGYNSQIKVEVINPQKVIFKHAIYGSSNSIFFKIIECIYDSNERVILTNEHYLSTKLAKLIFYTS
ncbi:GntR family transcriptional regulator [Secundilactobacillus silagincola]|uniref:GntR family transcriptional regulator n=1 Tax=Secundilactobacillus silagincola TaxID=1714681 RepID=A0A1Z5IZZ8_9LACO|nr:GntR family transcriptional regulator [Secundilactobacillus silagincola]GAX07343.1 GntR family transcriptional regulator [Secundilactobacillus silagincola]